MWSISRREIFLLSLFSRHVYVYTKSSFGIVGHGDSSFFASPSFACPVSLPRLLLPRCSRSFLIRLSPLLFLSLSSRHLSTLKFLWRVQFPTWLIGIKADGPTSWSPFKAPDQQKARERESGFRGKEQNRARRWKFAPTISALP